MKNNNLVGPIAPIPIPFNVDFSIDYESLKKYIEFLTEFPIGGIMTTAGTSSFNLLSKEEIFKVNEIVLSSSKNNIPVILGNPITGDLNSSIDFIKKINQLSPDYALIYYPERFYNESEVYSFFKTLNEKSKIPILIHEMPMRNGCGPGQVQYSIDLLKRIFKLENIHGMKEEALDESYSKQLLQEFSNNIQIIGAGGGMSRYFYRDSKYGVKAYLGGIVNFNPQFELDFYYKISLGKISIAKKSFIDIEKKLFETVIPFGWHPSLKAMLSIKGLMKNINRKPMPTIKGDKLTILKKCIKNI